MNKAIRKFISTFFLVTFFLASGAGQIIHAFFHDHNYSIRADKNSSSIISYHSFCTALQLTLPEFFESSVLFINHLKTSINFLFADIEPAIPQLFSFKNSDRAPPFLA